MAGDEIVRAAGPEVLKSPGSERTMPRSPSRGCPATMSSSLNPLDLYDVRGLLSEDEQMVQDSVARLVDEKVLPIIRECFEEHRFPKELVPELAALGLLGLLDQGLRLRRAQRRQLRAHLPGARARRLGHPQLRLRAVLAVHVSDLRLRQRGAEAEVPAAHGARRAHRLLRAHRAARRLRSGEHEDPCQRRRARTGSSTARRCGSPTARSRTCASAGR